MRGAAVPLLVATAGYLVMPLLIVFRTSLGATPAGFERGAASLITLAAYSVGLALASSLIAVAVSLTASLLTTLDPRFSLCYRIWLLVLLFTNPVFLVFGLSILLARIPPLIAVIAATTYILLPLSGQIIQSGVDEFDPAQARAASSLGASPLYVTLNHVVPSIRRVLLAAVCLGTVYALGFFLVPAYVGLGRIVTLGTVINSLANSVGDWTAASQMCVVTLATQMIVVLAWLLAARRGARRETA
jgi:ABC-type spermidine/putrescine transport system permease subunit II